MWGGMGDVLVVREPCPECGGPAGAGCALCGMAWQPGGKRAALHSAASQPLLPTRPARPQLMEEECPLPPPGQCSPELCDFVAQCMRKDPWARPTAEQLLRHPFIAQHTCVRWRQGRLWAGRRLQAPTLAACSGCAAELQAGGA